MKVKAILFTICFLLFIGVASATGGKNPPPPSKPEPVKPVIINVKPDIDVKPVINVKPDIDVNNDNHNENVNSNNPVANGGDSDQSQGQDQSQSQGQSQGQSQSVNNSGNNVGNSNVSFRSALQAGDAYTNRYVERGGIAQRFARMRWSRHMCPDNRLVIDAYHDGWHNLGGCIDREEHRPTGMATITVKADKLLDQFCDIDVDPDTEYVVVTTGDAGKDVGFSLGGFVTAVSGGKKSTDSGGLGTQGSFAKTKPLVALNIWTCLGVVDDVAHQPHENRPTNELCELGSCQQ